MAGGGAGTAQIMCNLIFTQIAEAAHNARIMKPVPERKGSLSPRTGFIFCPRRAYAHTPGGARG